ncbi:hypothetical protein CRX69_00490 [Pseudomonas rhizophila]|uniref:Uncharacterized protein n=1 Tax=Pseudomonas rhizophila TaxID=2045200 RepID=A0ABN5JKN4_9PSED|nr:hypothetical protein CRX69_00490 [Pseudomonas rhizophila]
MFTGFLVADMVYLLTDVSAAHTRPLLQPPLGHVDSTQDVALQGTKNLLPHCRGKPPLRISALA